MLERMPRRTFACKYKCCPHPVTPTVVKQRMRRGREFLSAMSLMYLKYYGVQVCLCVCVFLHADVCAIVPAQMKNPIQLLNDIWVLC